MEEETRSMAADALGSVNGGATMPQTTAAQTAPGQQTKPLDLGAILGLSQRTMQTTASAGVRPPTAPTTPFADASAIDALMGVRGSADAAAGQSPLDAQFRDAMAAVRRTLGEKARGLPAAANGGTGGATLAQMFADALNPNSWQPTPQPAPVGGAAAQRNGIAELPSGGGGAQRYGYQYGGMNVTLPGGVDVNDDAEVDAAVAEQNAVIDMMMGNDQQEEW